MTELAFSVAAKVIEKLGSLAYQEISLAWGISSDLKKLQLTMSTIQAVLLDAEEKQVKNRGLSVWLRQLKDVFYDATDVLDEFECEALKRQVVKTYGSTGRKVRRFFSSSNPLAFQFKMTHRIKEISVRLGEIAKDRAQFHLEERLDDKHILHRERDMTHSFVRDSDVIGRDGDKQKILDLLMHPGDYGNVSVIAIVGIGGMGKTILAQWVYNDEMIATNFDARIWVCVSHYFNILKLATEILKSAGGKISENMSMDEVQANLRNTLKEKRFFIVLDDVWNEDRFKWNDLKNLLNEGDQRSKIVVTTRSHKVASVISPGPIHNIKGLPEDDCLSLFLRWAFNEGEDKQYPKLLEIGKQIVKKCKGVPLAVRTLGSLLYSKTNDCDWISIRDSEIWRLKQQDDHILPVLRLSYNHLPSHLKQCFAYCSLYPKNHTYRSTDLILSWMANGLLQKSSQNIQELEDIGLQYAKELLSRSFFQEVEYYGDLFTFKIHDLLHDLSIYVAQNDYCLIENTNNTNNFETARHVSILENNLGVDEVTTFLHNLSNNVRTVIFPTGDERPFNIDKSLLETCISRFKYVRLLDLSFSRFEVLPSSISTLKHLRYLSLRGSMLIEKLPNSIYSLQNLETLKLAGCERLEELPKDIRNMINLRYLSITTKQTCLQDNGIECLRSLRTLIFYKCSRLECLPEGIQSLTVLRKLEFRSCGSLISLPHGMKKLTVLKSLLIFCCGKLNLMEEKDYPTSLRSLQISALPQLVALPQWLVGSACTLQYLCINGCDNLVTLPEWLQDLNSLQKLKIWACQKLTALPEGMDRLTALRELEIIGCPKLSRNCEREVGEDWTKIAHIPQVHID